MEMDSIIEKYFLLKKLSPDNKLLEYFVKNEHGFLPNQRLGDEFLERFGRDCPSVEEYVGDKEKAPLLGYTQGIIHRTYANYEKALDEEIDSLQDERLKPWLETETETEARTEADKEEDIVSIGRIMEKYYLLKEISSHLEQEDAKTNELLKYFIAKENGDFKPNPEVGISQQLFQKYGNPEIKPGEINTSQKAHAFVSKVFGKYERALEDRIIELQWGEKI